MKTGFKDLDHLIKLNKGELIIIASRPKIGKTTFVLNILSHNAIKENKPTLFFSLEENKEAIIKKLIASNSMVALDKLQLYNEYKKENKMENEKKLSEEDWHIYLAFIIFCF